MSSTNKHNAQISSANMKGGDLQSVNTLNLLYPDNNSAMPDKNPNYQNVAERQNNNRMPYNINNYDYSQNNVSQQFSQKQTKPQDNIVNTTRGLYADDYILSKETKVHQSPDQLTQNNIINNSSNMSYNESLVGGNHFSKNELIIETPNIYNQDLTADGVALNMEMERRVRMSTAWYEEDANELSTDYENKYNFLRNQIFDQTINLLNTTNAAWKKEENITDFHVNQSERQLQSELKKEFAKTKFREEKNEEKLIEQKKENKSFWQKNKNSTTVETSSNQIVDVKPQVVQELSRPIHTQEFMPKNVVKQETTKLVVEEKSPIMNKEVIDETIDVTNSSPSFNQINKNITNKEKVENFVATFNKENALNKKLAAKDTVAVDLNQGFYISNDRLSNIKSYDALTSGDKLDVSIDSNKYIREDSLGYNVLEKEVKSLQTNEISEENKTIIQNIEKENVNKIQSLEEILKSLTNELLSVNNQGQTANSTISNDKSAQSNTLQNNKNNIDVKETQKAPLVQNASHINTNATNFGGSSFQNNNQVNMIKPDLNANKPLFKANTISEENLPKMIKPDLNANKPLFRPGVINNGDKK